MTWEPFRSDSKDEWAFMQKALKAQGVNDALRIIQSEIDTIRRALPAQED